MKKIMALSILAVCTFTYVKSNPSAHVHEVACKCLMDNANSFHVKNRQLVGINDLHAFAKRQMKMWQASTWDGVAIGIELGRVLAGSISIIMMFLQHSDWPNYEKGFSDSLDCLSPCCKKDGVRPWLLFSASYNFPGLQLSVHPSTQKISTTAVVDIHRPVSGTTIWQRQRPFLGKGL